MDETQFEEAFRLGNDEGRVCSDLTELVTFVINLLDDNVNHGLREQLRIPAKKVKSDRAKWIVSGHRSWWFRGAFTDHHDLQSGIFRPKPSELKDLQWSRAVSDHADLDRRLQHEYFEVTRVRADEVNSNIWDRLFEMQHYLMPTRLLDWSSNLFTALFFAVYYAWEKAEKGENYDGHPTIWILNPRILSGVFLGEYALNDYPYLEVHGSSAELKEWKEVPALLKPRNENFGNPGWIYQKLIESHGHFPVQSSWTNPRLSAQAGCFTLQGSKEALNQLAENPRNHNEPRYLLKVRLSKDKHKIKQARDQLQLVGVDERYVFPEKAFASQSIKRQRGLSLRRKSEL